MRVYKLCSSFLTSQFPEEDGVFHSFTELLCRVPEVDKQ